MTRTASEPTPSLPPCMLAPELWDSSDNTEAIAACRLQCQRRFACAQEALTGPRHLVSSLNGVIAGVAIPEQNEYGTSKAHKAALKRLETIAEMGRAANAAATPCARSHQPPTQSDQDEASTSSSAEQTQPTVDGQQAAMADQQPKPDRPDMTDVIVLPAGWGATSWSATPARPVRRIPKGQVDIHGAARITGLAVATLRDYRHKGGGPKSWLAPGGPRGVVRYWVADIEAWMAKRQPRPTARAS